MAFKIVKLIMTISFITTGTYSMTTAISNLNSAVGFKEFEFIFLFFAGLATDIIGFMVIPSKENK